MGKVFDFDEAAVKALLAHPPKGLTHISVNEWHTDPGQNENTKIKDILISLQSNVIVQNGKYTAVGRSTKKDSLRDALKEQANKLSPAYEKGGLER